MNYLEPDQFRFLRDVSVSVLKGRCHVNQFYGRIAYILHLSFWLSETEWDITG